MHTFEHVVWGTLKHLTAGYLCYSVLEHLRRRTPEARSVLVLLVGTMFPDLVDKPLTFLGVLGYGRSFAHSLFTAGIVFVVVDRLARRWSAPDLRTAFVVGYLSHLLVDMYGEVTGGLYADTAFLLWPVVVNQPTGVSSFAVPVPSRTVFTVVMATAACLWLADGLVVASDAVRYLHVRLKPE